MTEANAAVEAVETETIETLGNEPNAQLKGGTVEAVAADKAAETPADAPKPASEAEKPADAAEKPAPEGPPDNWREELAGDDEDAMKLLKRISSPKALLKKVIEQDKLIKSTRAVQPMPDPKDEKAMAEWRKEQGIPDDPSGYVLPDTVAKRLTDDDKPILATFTDFAHKNSMPPAFVEKASEWYVSQMEAVAEDRAARDASALEEAEDALRKDWSHGEFKANMTLAKRAIEGIPGVGAEWSEFRGPDGKRLGDNPAFISWAADLGREKFGDVTFATGDSERKHTARRAEIETIRNTDFDRYEAEGLDKELRGLIEKDIARGKR